MVSPRHVNRGHSVLDQPESNNFQGDIVSKVSYDLDQTSGRLSQLVDECVALCTSDEDSQAIDVAEALTEMRRAHTNFRGVLEIFHGFQGKLDAQTRRLSESFDEFDHRVSRTALNYGLSLLPNELLSEILLYATNTVDGNMALSKVCRRFRTVVLSTRKFWDQHRLRSGMCPDEILTIARGNGFCSLKAIIHSNYVLSTENFNEGPKAILSLHQHLEELNLASVDVSYATEIPRLLGSAVVMPALHVLSIYRRTDGNLNYIPQFYETWDMPTLREMHTNFVPRPSFGRNLVRCVVSLEGTVPLKDLATFLSSCVSLQDLYIYYRSPLVADQDILDTPYPPAVANLLSLNLFFFGDSSVQATRVLVERIRFSSIRRLQLCPNRAFCSLIRDNPSFVSSPTFLIRELKITIWDRNGDRIRDFFMFCPQSVEILTIYSSVVPLSFGDGVPTGASFRAHHLQLVRFVHYYTEEIMTVFIRHLLLFLQENGLVNVQFEFNGCPGVKKGTYNVGTVLSALR